MNRKEFTIVEESGKEVKLCIRTPQYEDLELSDKVYAEKIASLLRENAGKRLLLRSQVTDFLKSTGVWTQEDEDKIEQLNTEIDDLLAKLRKGGLKVSEGRKLAIDTMEKRKDIVRISGKRQIFDDTTIEAFAENEKIDYLVYICTVYADTGENYWNSFEDMKNDKLSHAYRSAAVAAYNVIYNVNPEFEKRLPENRWLKKYGLIDDELNYLDRKTGKKVDRSGKPIEEVEKDLQKRIDNLQGEIEEEQPFIDDETNSPVIVEDKKEEEKEVKEEVKEEVLESK
jgi:hypothetical protein